MSSREQILANIKKNQPPLVSLPAATQSTTSGLPDERVHKFVTVLQAIGGQVVPVNSWDAIAAYVSKQFPPPARTINLVQELANDHPLAVLENDPHQLESVTLALLKGHFAVAENGAVWITDTRLGDRALPFICEHLALIVHADAIVPTMHDAYERIAGEAPYEFGTFIAGPSKTADIEQSLVLGAHGAKTLTLFLLSGN
ncbi:LutC/YkgG family protein [Chryseolinea soli]|uniref:Lactate utilization protein B/C n=1 Tax=Chryseolinea soli TaxID=2321403 RepID=A0A385SXG2_9BACT|nr:LUD domain-containing protein [Chryseolinea soli]AYB35634.1 lactate utilization protein B/C [Chryseolinea soli]